MRGSGAERRWNSHEKEKTHTGSTQRPRARSAGVAESLIGVRASPKSPTARGAPDGSAWQMGSPFRRGSSLPQPILQFDRTPKCYR